MAHPATVACWSVEMPIEILLHIETTAGGSWRVTCTIPDEAAARARVELTRVRRFRSQLDELAAGRGDSRVALATLFESSPALAGAFGAARGSARAQGSSLLLLVETTDAGVAAMPWESLDSEASANGDDRLDALMVARLAKRPTAQPKMGSGLSTQIELLFEDSVAERLSREIEAACIRHGLPRPCPSAVPVPPGHGSVMHLIVPTRLTKTLPRILGGSAVRKMGPQLARAELVTIWCAGDGEAPLDVTDITHRLLDVGARATLVPSQPVPLESSSRYLDALYGALSGGRTMAASVAAARRVLPGDRSASLGGVLTVSSGAGAATPLVRTERWPDGWPMPGAEAARMIEAAYVLAERSGSGFLGIEHLALALVDAAPRPALVRLRYQFSARRRQLESRLSGWSPRKTEPARPRPSPRLRTVGARLTVGFDPEMLWQVLFDVARPAIRVLVDEPSRTLRLAPNTQDGERTEGSDDTVRESFGPAQAIEIVTGPEDGRRINLAPGEALGRASGSRKAEHRLYAETSLTDAALSRRHIVWTKPGTLQLEAAIIHPRQEDGELIIGIGELAGLTRCTWIRGVGAEPTA